MIYPIQEGNNQNLIRRKYLSKLELVLKTRNLALVIFGKLLIVFSAKVNLSYLLYSSDKAKLLAKIFCSNSILDDSGISLPTFPSRINLNNISVSPKLVKKGYNQP